MLFFVEKLPILDIPGVPGYALWPLVALDLFVENFLRSCCKLEQMFPYLVMGGKKAIWSFW